MRVGITHGDYNGANYEILLKMFENPEITELCTPVIYGSPVVAAWYRKLLNLPQVNFNVVEKSTELKDGVVNMVNVLGRDEPEIAPGQSSLQAGNAARLALEAATRDLKEGVIDVLVTMPINKHNIQSPTFNFPGHTEYLEAVLADDNDSKALMILCSDKLRVALVTGHVPLRDVASLVTRENILEKLRIFNRSLQTDFTIPRPRIAVLSLNPHAGDNGVIGDEELKIIAPAIEEANSEGIMAFGPFAADGFFGSGHYTKFDGVLAMYHDQGLIPFKVLEMDQGVNFTAGLPFVRTSPDHGTAYDIAGRGVASPDSARAAIYKAIDIKRNRDVNRELFANPLPKLYNTTPNNRE